MVRFIILMRTVKMQAKVLIYIPIWLDLLFIAKLDNNFEVENLHSNMVRFIIQSKL